MFSYRGAVWSCFACGESGNAYQLAQRLALTAPARGVPVYERQTVAGLEEFFTGPQARPLREARVAPSARLTAAVARKRELRVEHAVDEERYGWGLVRDAHWLWDRETTREMAVELVFVGMTAIGRAWRTLGGRWGDGANGKANVRDVGGGAVGRGHAGDDRGGDSP